MRLRINKESVEINSIEDFNEQFNGIRIESISLNETEKFSEQEMGIICRILNENLSIKKFHVFGIIQRFSQIINSIKSINIEDFSVSFVEGGAIEWSICNLLKKSRAIKKISLYHNNYSTADIALIMDALHPEAPLEELDLAGNGIDHEGIKIIVDKLMKNTTLKVLELGGSRFGDPGLYHLSSLIHKTETLKRLDISSIGVDYGDQMDAFGLIAALRGNRSIEDLDVGFNKFNHLELLIDALGLNSNLKELRLCSADLDTTALRKIFSTLNNLVKLNIGRNGINSESVLAICDELQKWENLRSLNLSNNHIGDSGLRCICNSLKHLEELDVSHNRFSTDCGKILADFIRDSKLESLSIEECGIDISGFTHIVDAILLSSSMSRLSVSYNDDFSDLFDKLITNDKTVDYLQIQCDGEHSGIIEMLSTALKHNETITSLLLECDDDQVFPHSAIEKLCETLENFTAIELWYMRGKEFNTKMEQAIRRRLNRGGKRAKGCL